MPDLGPMFTDITISADEARAIVAALRDVAQVDGTHADEVALIEAFSAELHEELGEAPVNDLEQMNPKLLRERLVSQDLRMVAIQAAVMLAMADGAISEAERERVQAYARALGMSDEAYGELEQNLVGWVKSGDMEPVLGTIYD